ncbi:MAG: NGG1p interacting factor NIF3 [bacterium]|nr:NGG1p interacting factor NIF3 [bacterium]
MTIQQIYDLALEMGMKADPRGIERVKKLLKQRKKDFEELPEKKKKLFDKEDLVNPYSDSRLLLGDSKTQVKRVLAGIDMESGEVVLADRLGEKGKKIDLIITHHPAGHSLASLHEVMELQVETFADAGVPVNVAHALFQERMGYVKRRFGPINHAQAVDVARILEIPFLALHTIWDNMGDHFMKQTLGGKFYDTVGEVFETINSIPEYIEAAKAKSGPAIIVGSEKSRAGKVVINFTGGTNPSKELYVELAKAGVGTLVEMHVPEEAMTELKKLHINVIDCGHMAADSIGANLFFDQLEKRGVEVVPVSGLVRIKRTKKSV